MNTRFLRLLAERDWAFSPLVVDINGDLSQNDEKEIDVSSVVEKMIMIVYDIYGFFIFVLY